METIAARVGRAELGPQEIVIGEPVRENARVSAQQQERVSRGVAAIQERGVQRDPHVEVSCAEACLMDAVLIFNFIFLNYEYLTSSVLYCIKILEILIIVYRVPCPIQSQIINIYIYIYTVFGIRLTRELEKKNGNDSYHDYMI